MRRRKRARISSSVPVEYTLPEKRMKPEKLKKSVMRAWKEEPLSEKKLRKQEN